MTNEPCCPYCGHDMRLITRKDGNKLVNEGMDGPTHWIPKMTYRYYYRCRYCNSRSPLANDPERAKRCASYKQRGN